MKKILLLLLIALGFQQSMAQQNPFSYSGYFYYRNHLYLNTSSVLLNAAGLKAMAKDTAASVEYITKAAEAGLFDTMFISTRSSINFITKHKAWNKIRQIVINNANSFANPENIQISFKDIDNFWKIYDRLDEPGADSLIMNEYIMKGSVGLRTFFEKRMGLQPGNLRNVVSKRKKYFASIRNVSLSLSRYEPTIIGAAKKIKEIYPEAYFPPTYFTMGTFGAFGTADGGAGQLIGAEFLMDKNTVDTSELSAFEKFSITDTSRIVGIIIHELIHSLQQTTQDNSLLAMSINEGAADFITQLAVGFNINSKIHLYGNNNEKELWQQFSAVMKDSETGEWLYNGMNAKSEKPGDLGYYIGFKICETYYNKATDKKQAIQDILTIQDFNVFLNKSGYAQNFGYAVIDVEQ